METLPLWGKIIFFIIILCMWAFIAFATYSAAKEEKLTDFLPPAGVAAFASFLFMGPLCIFVWMILIIKMATIRN